MNANKFYNLSMVVFVVFIIMIGGCDKKPTVSSLSYGQEMINYISGTEEGKELFSQDIFPFISEQFKDQQGYLVYYEFDSTKRRFDIGDNDIGGPADMYGFADIYDAVVQINDTLYGKINRVIGEDTSFYRYVKIAVTRYAYFLKLYSDDYSYRGWRLWGYGVDNLYPDQYGYFRSSGGDSISAFKSGDVADVNSLLKNKIGFYFVIKNNMVKLPPGDSLTYINTSRDILFAEKDDAGRHYIHLTSDGSNYSGSWKMPSGTDKFYRLMTLEGSDYYERIDTLNIDGESQVVTLRVRYSDIVIPVKIDI